MSDKQTYVVSVPFSGYVRGMRDYSVSATSEEEALEAVRNGGYDDVLDTHIHRDDTESDWEDAYI